MWPDEHFRTFHPSLHESVTVSNGRLFLMVIFGFSHLRKVGVEKDKYK